MYPVMRALVPRFVPLWKRVLGEIAVGYVLPERMEDAYSRERKRAAATEATRAV
jgi:hypothetical protein